jgi:hypothetical protein
MEKVKYEKPIIQRLGYDRTVMGVTCVGGTLAGVGAACATGPTPGS